MKTSITSVKKSNSFKNISCDHLLNSFFLNALWKGMVLTCFLKDNRWGLAWPHKTSGYKVSGLSVRMPYFRSLTPLQLCRAMHPWQDYTIGREAEAVVGYNLQLDLGPDAAGSHFSSWIEIMLLSWLVLVSANCSFWMVFNDRLPSVV